MARLPRLWVIATSVASLAFLGSYCDLRADECNEGASSCTAANEIRRCSRAFAEAHSDWELVPCGAARTCMLDTSSKAFCARAPITACGPATSPSCSGATLSTCASLPDGGSVVDDQICESASYCGNAADGGYGCRR